MGLCSGGNVLVKIGVERGSQYRTAENAGRRYQEIRKKALTVDDLGKELIQYEAPIVIKVINDMEDRKDTPFNYWAKETMAHCSGCTTIWGRFFGYTAAALGGKAAQFNWKEGKLGGLIDFMSKDEKFPPDEIGKANDRADPLPTVQCESQVLDQHKPDRKDYFFYFKSSAEVSHEWVVIRFDGTYDLYESDANPGGNQRLNFLGGGGLGKGRTCKKVINIGDRLEEIISLEGYKKGDVWKIEITW